MRKKNEGVGCQATVVKENLVMTAVMIKLIRQYTCTWWMSTHWPRTMSFLRVKFYAEEYRAITTNRDDVILAYDPIVCRNQLTHFHSLAR